MDLGVQFVFKDRLRCPNWANILSAMVSFVVELVGLWISYGLPGHYEVRVKWNLIGITFAGKEVRTGHDV